MAKGLSKHVETLGEYLREQRLANRLSLRQLAEATGVSNPYLSQIERGLRRPSADVLQSLAKALRVSAETLYVQAGILSPDDVEVRSVELAIFADTGLTERQKQSLVDVYRSFRAAGEASPQTATVQTATVQAATVQAATAQAASVHTGAASTVVPDSETNPSPDVQKEGD